MVVGHSNIRHVRFWCVLDSFGEFISFHFICFCCCWCSSFRIMESIISGNVLQCVSGYKLCNWKFYAVMDGNGILVWGGQHSRWNNHLIMYVVYEARSSKRVAMANDGNLFLLASIIIFRAFAEIYIEFYRLPKIENQSVKARRRERVLSGLEMGHGEKLCENAKSMNEYSMFQSYRCVHTYCARASIAILLIYL